MTEPERCLDREMALNGKSLFYAVLYKPGNSIKNP